jgi:hypothetical protein
MNDHPNRLDLANGSYILWDTKEGVYRVALYEVRKSKSTDLELAVSKVLKKPVHFKSVKEIVSFIASASS